MKVEFGFQTEQEARKHAKWLASMGDLVSVDYNDFFVEWQVTIYEKDDDGILF